MQWCFQKCSWGTHPLPFDVCMNSLNQSLAASLGGGLLVGRGLRAGQPSPLSCDWVFPTAHLRHGN